jgi:putative hydrolase of the HAD superfamily
MSIQTIVFDFGNVLGFFSHQKAAEQLAAYTAAPVEDVMDVISDSHLEEEFESGRLAVADLRRIVCQRLSLNCTDEQFDLAVGDMFTPNPEACALVPALKPRYRLLLLSNTNEIHANQFRRQFAEMFTHFDALVLSHEVGRRKPEPEIYAHCHRLAHCPPSQCLFIDDLPANIEAARAHGWHGIVYRPGLDLRRELCNLGIELTPSPLPLSPKGRGDKDKRMRG